MGGNIIQYSKPRAVVMTNGQLSNIFFNFPGTRQGHALSAMLFILFVKPVAVSVRADPIIKGIHIGGKEHKLLMYAKWGKLKLF